MKIRWPLFVRRLHKWLALVIGLQVVLWTATGFYMVVVHIDRIHGDHLVKPVERPALDMASSVAPATVLEAVPNATDIRSSSLLGHPVWRVAGSGGVQLFDATTGKRIQPVSAEKAEAMAQSRYTSGKAVSSVRLRHARARIASPVPDVRSGNCCQQELTHSGPSAFPRSR